MKRKLITLFTVLTASLLATSFPLHAGDKEGKGAKGAKGSVSSLSDTSITVTTKKGDQTFQITPDTKFVKEDGTNGVIGDIASGTKVKVTPNSAGDSATQIAVLPPKKNK